MIGSPIGRDTRERPDQIADSVRVATVFSATSAAHRTAGSGWCPEHESLGGSAASPISLVRTLEPDSHSARGLNRDQAAEKPVAASLDDNLVLQAVGAAGGDDLVDLLRSAELELPAEPLRVSRLLSRRALQSDDRFPVPDSQEAREFLALVDTLEAEQFVERTLGVLVIDVHDRMKLHCLMLSHACRTRQ
jgi:hypothetical protein